MMIKIIITATAIALFLFSSAYADKNTRESTFEDVSPYQFSICHPVSYPYKKSDIEGCRFNLIYGKNKKVRGFDIGLIQYTTEISEGIQLGVLNKVNQMNGLQYSLICNHAKTSHGTQASLGFNKAMKESNGLQLSPLFNLADTMHGKQATLGLNLAFQMDGAQIAFLSNISKNINGPQISVLFNEAYVSNGPQIGIVNASKKEVKTQVGLINIANKVNGHQIGLINIGDGRIRPFFNKTKN